MQIKQFLIIGTQKQRGKLDCFSAQHLCRVRISHWHRIIKILDSRFYKLVVAAFIMYSLYLSFSVATSIATALVVAVDFTVSIPFFLFHCSQWHLETSTCAKLFG